MLSRELRVDSDDNTGSFRVRAAALPPPPRALALFMVGACLLPLASLFAQALTVSELFPPSALPARAFYWLAGPSGSWIAAIALFWAAVDLLVARSWGQAGYRLAGTLAAAAGVAGLWALSVPQDPKLCFERGGLLGSLLVDFRALDLTWRLGREGATTLLGVLAAVGFAAGFAAVRGLAWRAFAATLGARGEALRVIDGKDGARCIAPAKPRANVRKSTVERLAVLTKQASSAASSTFSRSARASREASAPSFPSATSTTSAESTATSRRERALARQAAMASAPAAPAISLGMASDRFESRDYNIRPYVPPAPEDPPTVPDAASDPDAELFARLDGLMADAEQGPVEAAAAPPLAALAFESTESFNFHEPLAEEADHTPMMAPLDLRADVHVAPLATPRENRPTEPDVAASGDIPLAEPASLAAPPLEAHSPPMEPAPAEPPAAPTPVSPLIRRASVAAQESLAEPRVIELERIAQPRDPDDPAATDGADDYDFAVERYAPEDWFAKYQPPALDLLAAPSTSFEPMTDDELAGLARRLQTALDDFGVGAEVVEVTQGPVVTLLELRLARGVKVSRVASLEADLALAMRSPFVRVQTIPGKAAVGVEIVNERAAPVVLRDVIGAEEFWRDASPLLFAMGKTVDGSPYVCDLERLPHLLIAGATGSGKSVCLNALICSILYHVSPEMARFVLIDPKRVELNVYDDIPHLAAPIVSEPEEAAAALAWALDLMNERYRRLQTMRARNIARYNDIALGRRRPPRPDMEPPAYMPRIVIVIDELADLMLTMRSEIEDSLARLAQMSRAVGIHLVVATQRPSVNVVTGLIKANFPSRVAFQVSSKVDSRTILDCNGAECLRGRGDMLFSPGGALRPARLQGALVTDEEVERLCDFLRESGQPWPLCEDFGPWIPAARAGSGKRAARVGARSEDDDSVDIERDDLLGEAARLCVESGGGTLTLLSERLGVGRLRATRLLERLEREGVLRRQGRRLVPAVSPEQALNLLRGAE